MENASKALLMAAGVLIGILLISLAVYLFVDFGSTSAEINSQNTQKQLIQFNAQFTSYEGKEDITIYDIITVAGKAHENNIYYSDSLNENEIKIIVQASNKKIEDFQDKVSHNNSDENKKYTTYISKFIKAKEEEIEPGKKETKIELTKFTCKVTKYHENGKVAEVVFTTSEKIE